LAASGFSFKRIPFVVTKELMFAKNNIAAIQGVQHQRIHLNKNVCFVEPDISGRMV
jgi:hypothetical protein